MRDAKIEMRFLITKSVYVYAMNMKSGYNIALNIHVYWLLCVSCVLVDNRDMLETIERAA